MGMDKVKEDGCKEAAPEDHICMCIKEPKLVQLFYDAMGMESVYNKETGYAKICGHCEIELEGHLGNKGILKENMGRSGRKKSPMMEEDDDGVIELEN